MPYSNIVFVKLFIAIIDEDDRFLYQLNESQQLLYLKMLILAGKTGNNIPKTYTYIKNTINYNHEQGCFDADIKRIRAIFPKLKETDNGYYFEKFEELHNYIDKEVLKAKKEEKKKQQEIQRKSAGTPQETQRTLSDVEVEVDKEVDKDIHLAKEVSPVKQLMDYFFTAFEKTHNKKYVCSFGKDMSLAKKLLQTIPLEELKILVDKYFMSTDSFICNSSYDFGIFNSQINKLRIGGKNGFAKSGSAQSFRKGDNTAGQVDSSKYDKFE